MCVVRFFHLAIVLNFQPIQKHRIWPNSVIIVHANNFADENAVSVTFSIPLISQITSQIFWHSLIPTPKLYFIINISLEYLQLISNISLMHSYLEAGHVNPHHKHCNSFLCNKIYNFLS